MGGSDPSIATALINGGEMAGASIALPAIGAVLMALRFFTKCRLKMSLVAEDWLIIPAFLLLTVMAVLSSVGTTTTKGGISTGTDQPVRQSTMLMMSEPVYPISKLFYHISWMQTIVIGCIKLSFLFFYVRVLCSTINRVTQVILSISIAVVAIWMFTFVVLWLVMLLGEFHERAIFWPLNLAFAWSDMAMDVFILLIPIRPVMRLSLSKVKKAGILSLFMLGGITAGSSLVRAIFYIIIKDYSQPDWNDPTQATSFNMIDVAYIYWTLLETGLAFIAVNVPIVVGLLRRSGSQHKPSDQTMDTTSSPRSKETRRYTYEC